MMKSTINETCYSTDAPAIDGEIYGKSYLRALHALQNNHTEEIIDNMRDYYAVDLPDFLRNALIYSGNLKLSVYVNNMEKALEDILVIHLQSDRHRNYISNVYFEDMMIPVLRERYRACSFEKLTGWYELCEKIFEFDSY
ncbi:hypothetical protein [Bacteroides caecimuris]|uniref:hypothetical protein n=1 Tax=Bacteroides caecimuris TaxID=1796613 RepID=UPI0025731C1B|nr:hypothetical protein [Bacteroides caecimuris]